MSKKVTKVKQGHSLKEYKRKYGKYYDTGVIGKNSKKPQVSRTNWNIENEYYPVPKFSDKARIWWINSSGGKKAVIITSVVALLGTAIALPLYFTFRTHGFDVTIESNNTLDLTNKHASANTDYKTGIVLLGTNDNYPTNLDVYVNNEKINEFEYINNGDSASLKIDAKFVKGNIKVVGQGKDLGFSNTDWSTIIKILNNGGVKALKNHFKPNGNSFVGLTHSIDIEGKPNARVKVIGERQDSLEGFNKSASLTFAFCDPQIVDGGAYRNYKNLTYTDSLIQNKCKTLYNKITNSDLKNAINSVNKSFAYYDNVYKESYDISSEHVFALSFKEIGGFDFNALSAKDTAEKELSYECENNCYTYFNSKNSEKLYSGIKTFIPNDGDAIWTRTPSVTENSITSNHGYAIAVKNNGGTIEFEEHDMSIDADSYYFIPAFTIGQEDSFETDSWANLIQYANEGYDRLKEIYGVDTFVGLEKKMAVGDEYYRLRVIGENHDQVSGSNKRAALTFEFTRPIDGTRTTMSTGKIGEESNWEISNARKLLSTTVYNQLPEVVRNNLQFVDKYSAIKYNSAQQAIPGTVKTSDQIFALSRKEIGAADDAEALDLIKDPYSAEGDTYTYYQEKYNDYKKLGLDAKTSRVKQYAYNKDKTNSGSREYLLRSVNTKDITKTQIVLVDGSIDNENKAIFNDYNILPCFCIGVSGNYLSFETDSWANIVANANSKNSEEFAKTYGYSSIDNLIGKQRYINVSKDDGTTDQYKVRVIGVNHDTLANDSTKKALLTFEFTRCINNAVRYSESGLNNWSSSDLRSYCNSNLIAKLPEDVKNNIKPVVKTTYRADTDKYEKTIEKMFPLSIKEIGNSSTPLSEPSDGEVYKYYDIKDETAKNNARIKGGALCENYHLRTPSLSSDYINLVYCINSSGSINNHLDAQELMGVAPAFAI